MPAVDPYLKSAGWCRDAQIAGMTEADWAAIEDRLRSAYGLLKKAASSLER
jgi:hypothetical protein